MTLLSCWAGVIFHTTASLKLAKCPAADSCNSGWTWTPGSLTLFFQLLNKYNLLLIIFAGWKLSQLYPVPIARNYFHAIHKDKCGDSASSNPHPTFLLHHEVELKGWWPAETKPDHFCIGRVRPWLGMLIFLACSPVSSIRRRQGDKKITSIISQTILQLARPFHSQQNKDNFFQLEKIFICI